MPSNPAKPVLKVLLCSPRGFCAGVVRAIESVERALAIYGAPVYVRHEIVHNRYVVDSLRAKGAIFVEELSEVPNDHAPVIFSAHGVARAIPEEAQRRNLFTIDATCPLVTKVHREAEIHNRRGREIVLIGHAGHPEVVGTMGQLPPGSITLVETLEDVTEFTPRDANKLAYVTQTTLSVDDTAAMVELLKQRFPGHLGSAQGRHLLRDHEPPGCGQARRAHRRRHDRCRRAQFIEFATAERSGREIRLSARGADAACRRDRMERF